MNGPQSQAVTTTIKPRKSWMRPALVLLSVIVLFYGAAFAGFEYAMYQPPETFSRVMMHTGPVPFLLFPFETMWKQARAGHLTIGQEAPDFTLPLLDRSPAVSLSSFRGKQPVVLVFGSYT